MRFAALILGLSAFLAGCESGGDGGAAPPSVPAREREGFALDFEGAPDVPAGGVPALARERGWERVLGNPVYFFLADERLHLVAKPGPVHDRRVLLAITDREKLRTGLESKVILRLTPPDFGIDPVDYPRLRIRMAPVTLPGEGADLRDSSRNDACFYLLLGFGEPRHDFSGIVLPDTVAYVWANVPWEDERASDPDYREFMRYVAVGHGEEDPGRIREIVRDVAADYRAIYGAGPDEPLPLVRSVAVMVDANTVGTKAESVLESFTFLGPDGRAAK